MGEFMTRMVGPTPVEALVEAQTPTWSTPFEALSWVPGVEAEFNQAMLSPYPDVTNHQLDKLGDLATFKLRQLLLGDITAYLEERGTPPPSEERMPTLEQRRRYGRSGNDGHFRK
jgi:hypothetical protein